MQSFSVTSPKDLSGHNTTSTSYTTTQSYTKMYIIVSWTLPQEGYHGNEGASIVLTVGGVTKLNRSIAKNESGSETVEVSNITSGTVIATTITSPTGGGNAGAYWTHTMTGTISYSASQAGIIKPLIPTELKNIGQQSTGTSYGRLNDGTWYGEFDGEIHNSATTGSVTLGNCIGFKVITDSNGEKYKVPIFGM